ITTPDYGRMKINGNRIWLYDGSRKPVLILDPDGRTILDARKFAKLDKVESERGLLWLYDADNNLIQLLDHDGQPFLSADKLAKLKQYSVFTIDSEGDSTQTYSLPLAWLSDYDKDRRAVLTAAGDIVSQPEW